MRSAGVRRLLVGLIGALVVDCATQSGPGVLTQSAERASANAGSRGPRITVAASADLAEPVTWDLLPDGYLFCSAGRGCSRQLEPARHGDIVRLASQVSAVEYLLLGELSRRHATGGRSWSLVVATSSTSRRYDFDPAIAVTNPEVPGFRAFVCAWQEMTLNEPPGRCN